VDHDKSGHSVISTSLEDVEFPERVVSVVNYLQEKRALDFDWHQVSRKSWIVGQGFGRNHGLDQQKEIVLLRHHRLTPKIG
jgi:hypothetical protein